MDHKRDLTPLQVTNQTASPGHGATTITGLFFDDYKCFHSSGLSWPMHLLS
jgi:hypothetical protein